MIGEPFHTWKKKKVPVKDSLNEEIRRWEVASQSPKERRDRQNRRFHMLRNKPSEWIKNNGNVAPNH